MMKRVRTLRLWGEAGYSIIEMLTVMGIMSIVFAGITTIFVAGSKAQAEQDRRYQAQVATQVALDRIRRDAHCANDATPYATDAVTLKRATGCGGDVSWCTAAVSGYTNRYSLYRQLGTTCSSGTGVKVADYLINANAFPGFAHTTGCECLASLQVVLAVSLQSDSRGAYELTDTIYLRNSTRI
jgi:type II secretory pathway pseudopilin PulG